MIIHKETISIRKDLVDDINELLAGEEILSGVGDSEVIFIFSKEIADTDFEVDVKVVSCDGQVYIDAVLFESGSEVMCMEPHFGKIEGHYIFEVDNDTKIVLTVDVTEYNALTNNI